MGGTFAAGGSEQRARASLSANRCNSNGLIEGLEALLRWNPPDSDSVPPGIFILVAERSGLIVPLSRWVLTTGSLEAVSWHRQNRGERPLYVRINMRPEGYFFSKPVPSKAVRTIVDLNKRQAKHARRLEVQRDLSV